MTTSFVSLELRRKWNDFSIKEGNDFVTIPNPIAEHWHGWEPFQVLPDVGQHWDPSAEVERADQLRVCQGLLRLCGVPLPGQALLRTLGGCHERGKQPRRPGDLPNTCWSCQVSQDYFRLSHFWIWAPVNYLSDHWFREILKCIFLTPVTNKGLCLSWKC